MVSANRQGPSGIVCNAQFPRAVRHRRPSVIRRAVTNRRSLSAVAHRVATNRRSLSAAAHRIVIVLRTALCPPREVVIPFLTIRPVEDHRALLAADHRNVLRHWSGMYARNLRTTTSIRRIGTRSLIRLLRCTSLTT